VKLSTEKNILVIEGSKDPMDGDEPARYTYTRSIRVPSEAFEMEQIKAKDGTRRARSHCSQDQEQ
jgi:hypothetical protein